MTLLPPELLKNRIRELDPFRFVELCNMVLGEVASRHGIPRTHLATTASINDPDGGIDATCVDSPSIVPRIIPRANTDYQFKAGRDKRSLETFVRKDILDKPRVRAGLEAGNAFVVFSTQDRAAGIESQIADRITAHGVAVSAEQVGFVGVSQLAALLQTYPALLARFAGVDAALMDFQQWAAIPPMANEFQEDDAVVARLAELTASAERPGSTVRVVGAAGNGKTRMLLEALRRSTLVDSVIYLPQASDFSAALRSHLLMTEDVRCTLVIDEVDDASAENITNFLAARPPGIRLLMIGLDASGRPPANALQVEGLSEELLTRAVLSIAPGLPEDVALGIARDCERSPKLAVLLATCVRDDPSLVGPRALRHGDVRSALDRYLKLDEGGIEWKAISTASLLMHLGWEGDAEHESTALFEAVGLNASDARRAVNRLHQRHGIAPTAGRFRYVSPAILADHLAAKQLEAWTAETLRSVFAALTPAMADSFSRRARRLSAILPNRALIEEVLLGDRGPFRSLNDLESSGLSTVLHRLAAAFPWGVLRTLERCISDTSLEELQSAKRSRRDCVWALEEIQWRADTFERASKLLLRLALAENETWGNNATGDWVETFQTALGRTAAGGPSRVTVLRHAASLPEAAARVLAAKAIRAAFRTGQVSRAGMPPVDVEGMPAREWFPETYGEWWDALVSYLDVLQKLLVDESEDVRMQAVETLSDIVADLFHVGDSVVSKWKDIAESLVAAPLEMRAGMFRDLDWALDRWSKMLETEDWPEEDGGSESSLEDREEKRASQREFIQSRLAIVAAVRAQLEGSDFKSRLRATLTRRNRWVVEAVERDQNQTELAKELEELAKEAVQELGLLDDQWQWLLDDKEWLRSEQWVETLARHDRDERLSAKLRELARESSRARVWLAVYWMTRSKATGDPALIDRVADDLISVGEVLSAFELTLRSVCTAERVERIRTLLQEGAVPPELLYQITYSGWLSVLDSGQIARLIAATAYGDSSGGIITLLEAYLRTHPDATQDLRDAAVGALKIPMLPKGPRDAYAWAELAKRYADTSPLEIGEATLDQIESLQTAHDAELHQVLRSCWAASDRQEFFYRLLSPRLIETKLEKWWSRQAIEHLPLQDLGTDFLIDWVRSDPENRAYPLAAAIRAPHGRPSELHGRMLAEFDEHRVGSAFSADYNSGSFMGSAAAWARGKLEGAKVWLTDDRPAVRRWGEQMVRGLEADIRHSEYREAEERLFF